MERLIKGLPQRTIHLYIQYPCKVQRDLQERLLSHMFNIQCPVEWLANNIIGPMMTTRIPVATIRKFTRIRRTAIKKQPSLEIFNVGSDDTIND
jgi:hypothetical protein